MLIDDLAVTFALRVPTCLYVPSQYASTPVRGRLTLLFLSTACNSLFPACTVTPVRVLDLSVIFVLPAAFLVLPFPGKQNRIQQVYTIEVAQFVHFVTATQVAARTTAYYSDPCKTYTYSLNIFLLRCVSKCATSTGAIMIMAQRYRVRRLTIISRNVS